MLTQHITKAVKTKILFLVVVFFTIVQGCKTKTACPEGLIQAKGEIISISGPQNLHIGQKATLSIGVRNNPTFCVQEAEASIINQGLDTFVINASLLHIGTVTSNDCGCKKEDTVYTLIYFTPTTAGNYKFIVGPGSTTSMDPSENIPGFVVSVE